VRKVLTLVGAAAGAAAAGVAATLAAAWLTATPAMFLAAGWVTATTVWLVAGRALPHCSRRCQMLGWVALSVILAAALVPLGDPVRSPATPPGAGRWTLPDGGWLSFAFNVVSLFGGRWLRSS
jgi:hypothetical protein